MSHHAHRISCRTASRIISLIILALLTLPSWANAGSNLPPPPTAYKKYYVHYDVNANGTYIEQDELAITVLNAMGVQLAQQLPVGTPNIPLSDPGMMEVKIMEAYTLKKNGKRIKAHPFNPQAMLPPNSPSAPALALPYPVMAFQEVEIGDTLELSYKVIAKKAPFPDNLVIRQFFPKLVQYDDAQISLKAPASLNLRAETTGVDKGTSTVSGNSSEWLWKYQNKEANLSSQNVAILHISSFKSNADEMQAFQKVARSMPPPEIQGCRADIPDALNYYLHQVESLLWVDGKTLEQLVSAWTAPSCVFKDGRPIMMAMDAGYSQAFSDERDWSKSYARITELKKQFPQKAFVALAEVRYWIDYAWNARGGGYASSVTQDGWKLFRQRLEKAEKVLLESKPYASSLPAWYDDMIVVQSALGRPADERDQVFLEGTGKFKTYYPVYFTMLDFISPKWGGDWETVDNMVKWSVDHTKSIDGHSMYARLYWFTNGSLPPESSLFKDTLASWPKMRQGFTDLMARHPDSKWNLNNFAKFACMAGDKKTFLTLRREMGKDILNDAWPQNLPLDLCEAKFGYAQ